MIIYMLWVAYTTIINAFDSPSRLNDVFAVRVKLQVMTWN